MNHDSRFPLDEESNREIFNSAASGLHYLV